MQVPKIQVKIITNFLKLLAIIIILYYYKIII